MVAPIFIIFIFYAYFAPTEMNNSFYSSNFVCILIALHHILSICVPLVKTMDRFSIPHRKELSISDILKDNTLYMEFLTFSIKDFSVESVRFLYELEQLKKMFSHLQTEREASFSSSSSSRNGEGDEGGGGNGPGRKTNEESTVMNEEASSFSLNNVSCISLNRSSVGTTNPSSSPEQITKSSLEFMKACNR